MRSYCKCRFVQTGQWRLSIDVTMQPISDAVSYGADVIGEQFFCLTGKTSLVYGALCWSVISIADAGFCRRHFQQTQGSPSVSSAWLKWNSCAWEISGLQNDAPTLEKAYFLHRYVAPPPAHAPLLFLCHVNIHKGSTHMGFVFFSFFFQQWSRKIISKLPAAIIFCMVFDIKN